MFVWHLYRPNGADYDEVEGWVIVAKSARAARLWAASDAHGPGQRYGDEGPAVWEDSSESVCTRVGVAAPSHAFPHTVMRAFRNG